MDTSTAWVEAVAQRFSSSLPHKVGVAGWSPANKAQYKKTTDCIIGLSKQEFSTVINGLSAIIAELIQTAPPTNASTEEKDSYVLVLDCLTSCLAMVCIGKVQMHLPHVQPTQAHIQL
jgi:hypothetical protein